MILVNELKGRMVAKGLTHQEVAKKMEIVPKTLYSKFKKGVLGSDEIEKLLVILDIRDPLMAWAIFFAPDVTRDETNEAT